MTSQSLMWLCLLLVVTLMSIPGFLRTSIRWWWDALTRIVLITFVCVSGMLVPSISWYAVILGWGFVLFCFFAQKRYEKQQQMALLSLDSTKLRNAYKNIEWLNWGLNGSLYKDLNESMALYIDQKPAEAEKLLSRWDDFPGMPASITHLPRAYRTTGDHILMHWQKLIDDYESLVKEPEQPSQTVPPTESTIDSSHEAEVQSNSESNVEARGVTGSEPGSASIQKSADTNFDAGTIAERKRTAQMMLLHVARAYAEQNRLREAAWCLSEFKVASQTGLNQQHLALTFLPFFALSGETERTESLLEAVRKPYLTDYILQQTDYCKEHAKYWLARCARASGNETMALQYFKEARDLSATDLFRSRIDRQLSQEPQIANGRSGADQIWKDVKAAQFVQDVLRPVNTPWSLAILILCIFAVFPLTELYSFLKEPPQPISSLIGVIDQLGNGSITRLSQGKFGYQDVLQVAAILKLHIMGNFALIPQLVFLRGEVWRLVTYLFLHAHFTHMMLNVLGLFFFGRMAESVFGTPKFLVIYFLGGILSGVYTCMTNFQEPVIGASGAIFAVFGAVGAAIYRLRDRIPEQVWKKQVGIILGLALLQVALDHSNIIKQVSGAAHLGGLVSGALIGFLMPINITKQEQYKADQAKKDQPPKGQPAENEAPPAEPPKTEAQ